MLTARLVSVIGIIVGGITTILALLTAFGIDLSEDQKAAIGGFAGLVLLVISTLFNPDLGPTPPAPQDPPA